MYFYSLHPQKKQILVLGCWNNVLSGVWIFPGSFVSGKVEHTCMIIGGGDPSIPSKVTLNIPLAQDAIMHTIWNGIRPSPPGVILNKSPKVEAVPMIFRL